MSESRAFFQHYGRLEGSNQSCALVAGRDGVELDWISNGGIGMNYSVSVGMLVGTPSNVEAVFLLVSVDRKGNTRGKANEPRIRKKG
mgnify:CR=1 FL=1